VQWPIEGGLLARSAGGHLRIELVYGRLVESVDGYRPMLPRSIYRLTQVPVHHLLTRLHLLRVRGRVPEPGPAAGRSRRLAAAAIDIAICTSMAAVIARRPRRLPLLLGIAAGYHVACWGTSGVTIGGAVMKQRVVAVDGSRVSVGQAIVRLALAPPAAIGLRVHDDIAGTAVVSH